jgi:hypothetical protein
MSSPSAIVAKLFLLPTPAVDCEMSFMALEPLHFREVSIIIFRTLGEVESIISFNVSRHTRILRKAKEVAKYTHDLWNNCVTICHLDKIILVDFGMI